MTPIEKAKDLKPCPFCGSDPFISDAQHTNAGVDMIICSGCGCRMYSGTVEKWNNRAALEADKPAEDAQDVLDALIKTVVTLDRLDFSDVELEEMIKNRDEKRLGIIQQYAESYHAKKCAECKAAEAKR